MDYQITKRVLQALESAGVAYKIFGGVALNLHGLARATEDLDLFIAPKTQNIENLRDALRQVFDDPNLDEIDANDLLGDYPAIQYVPPGNNFHIDILTRLGEAYSFDDLETQIVDMEGLQVTVVTPQTLYEMKKSTIRPQDWADADRLRQRFQLDGT